LTAGIGAHLMTVVCSSSSSSSLVMMFLDQVQTDESVAGAQPVVEPQPTFYLR